MKRIIKIPPPPFMQGGVLREDGITRNEQGYPLDSSGNIDIEATKMEAMKHQWRLERAMMNTAKGSKFTPPKKRRK